MMARFNGTNWVPFGDIVTIEDKSRKLKPAPDRYADMSDGTLRHKVAIVGVGETQYFKHGQSPDPEFKLALKAIMPPVPAPASRRTRSTASLPAAMIATMPCGCNRAGN